MDKRSRSFGAVVGSWYNTDVGSIFLYVLLFIVFKPTTTTTEKYKLICKIKMNRVEDHIMTNFPYDIQMTAMFIFITLYLVMDIIF